MCGGGGDTQIDTLCNLAHIVLISNFVCTKISYYKECAHFARTLLGRLLHAGCYNLEMVIRWISVHLNFPPLRTFAKLYMLSAGKGSKNVGVVAAMVEVVSFQQKTVLKSSQTAKADRSDLSSSFRLGHQLQTGIICKCRSYSRLPNHPSST